jgi:DNA-binding transcriptional regulator GbsR (MarR family)
MPEQYFRTNGSHAQILELLKEKEMSRSELTLATGYSVSRIKETLTELLHLNLIERVDRGVYKIKGG